MSKKRQPPRSLTALPRATAATRTYDATLSRIVELIAEGRQRAARAINAEMVATYWLVGRHIVEEEQRGAKRAGYGDALVARLAQDLAKRFGRGLVSATCFG